jgi:hypothetical protein
MTGRVSENSQVCVLGTQETLEFIVSPEDGSPSLGVA